MGWGDTHEEELSENPSGLPFGLIGLAIYRDMIGITTRDELWQFMASASEYRSEVYITGITIAGTTQNNGRNCKKHCKGGVLPELPLVSRNALQHITFPVLSDHQNTWSPKS
ncbi:hypothetical protein BTVI_69182 [Pitangus sulphuratus]|nr:hypothetical protein BTVI_69182 [Pitangus sulphuratus]